MKKIMKTLFITILLIIGTGCAFSQSLGVQAGVRLNASEITYPGVDISRKAGFEGGLAFRQPIYLLPLGVRAALLYSRQEFNLKSDMGNSTGITYHFIEDNLKLPVTLEWRPMGGLIKPFVQGGLYASYCVSGKIKDSDSSTSLKYRKDGNKMDYGVIAGVGAYITSRIALHANYEYSFSKRDLALGDQFVAVRNQGCTVALNYFF